ncbi:MAG: hypothetical protein Q7J82_08520 [Coriobacteriia bacterium]|nr:hypothetical protein [Coriobacteriia bacterium]
MLESEHVDLSRPRRELLVSVRGRLTRIFPDELDERFDQAVDLYTVADFANELGKSPEALLEQLRAAGVHKQGPRSPLLSEDKQRLLAYLKEAHGVTGERKKITLKKKGATRVGHSQLLISGVQECERVPPQPTGCVNKVILVGNCGRQSSENQSAALLMKVFRAFHGRAPVWFEARVLASYEVGLEAIRDAVDANDKAATIRAIQQCFETPDSHLRLVVSRAILELVADLFSRELVAQVSIVWESSAKRRAPRKLKTGRLRADNAAAACAASWLKRYKRLFPACAATISLN